MIKITKYGVVKTENRCVGMRYENATTKNGVLSSYTKVEDWRLIETPILIWNKDYYTSREQELV